MSILIIELLIVLLALYVGSRYGSIALGAISGIGLALLILGFGMAPGTPPTDVIYIIIAAVTCAGVLQAAGGMDFLIQAAERLLRKHPGQITFLAPLVTFALTVCCGTGHLVYTMMPIISDIALKKGIRPERPCSVASIAAQAGIVCSPISAAVVGFVGISAINGFSVSILQVIAVTVPAVVIGILMAAVLSYHRGLDLDKDREFIKRNADPEMHQYMYGNTITSLNRSISSSSKLSVGIFLCGIALIVLFAIFQDYLPHYDHIAIAKGAENAVSKDGFSAQHLMMAGIVEDGITYVESSCIQMLTVIQIIMLTTAGLIIICCKVQPGNVVTSNVWQSGMVAVVAIYGVAWLSDTFFANYLDLMKESLGSIVSVHPWTIAFVLFIVSILTNTQGGTVAAMLPLAYSMGIPGTVLLGVLPSVYGYFFIPKYPSDIATVSFDRSGTTIIGKYLLNHSFMMPGLVCVITATIVAYGLSMLFNF